MSNNTRLDRLFLLLSSGSNVYTRQSAAFQIGALLSSNYEILNILLKNLSPVFRHSSWDARIAAGMALKEILTKAPLWTFHSNNREENSIENYKDFKVKTLIQNGISLTSSSDFSVDSNTSVNKVDKNTLKKSLGLEFTTDEFLSTETETNDFSPFETGHEGAKMSRNIAELFEEQIPSKNKKIKREESPLSDFTSDCLRDVFHGSWEVRHGSVTALRELLLVSLESFSSDDLLIISFRLLSMIALDRFGDFISDQVVAPVRETGAQALALILRHFEIKGHSHLFLILDNLLLLALEPIWEIRHGALLVFKYTLPSCSSNQNLIFQLYPFLLQGLHDTVDDVVSVAASALIPLTKFITQKMTSLINVSDLISQIWNFLEDLDDLAASTPNLIELLSQLLKSFSESQFLSSSSFSDSLTTHSSRLLPFLSHGSSAVRSSTLEAYNTLFSLPNSSGCLSSLAQDVLPHLFLMSLVENNEENARVIQKLWITICNVTELETLLYFTCPLYGNWLSLISQSPNAPLLSHLLPLPRRPQRRRKENEIYPILYLGGSAAQNSSNFETRDILSTRSRILGARLLGYLAGFIVQPVPNLNYSSPSTEPLHQFNSKILLPHLTNKRSAYYIATLCLVIREWRFFHDSGSFSKTHKKEENEERRKKDDDDDVKMTEPNKILTQKLYSSLEDVQNLEETTFSFASLQSEALDFIKSLKSHSIAGNDVLEICSPLSLSQISSLVKIPDRDLEDVEGLLEKKNGLLLSFNSFKTEQESLEIMTAANLVGALISLNGDLPLKLNPIIKPLMESIKRERNEDLQRNSGRTLARLLDLTRHRTPCPNDKVISNLISFASHETHEEFTALSSSSEIHTLFLLNRRRNEGGLNRRKGKKHECEVEENGNEEERKIQEKEILRRGAILTLEAIVTYFGAELRTKVPKLWELGVRGLLACQNESSFSSSSLLIDSLKTLHILAPFLHDSLHVPLYELLSESSSFLFSETASSELRYNGARLWSQMALLLPLPVLQFTIYTLVPKLKSSELRVRQGIIEVLYMILNKCSYESLMNYVVLLILPVLGRMSDGNESIRILASSVFATLIRLLPLDSPTSSSNEVSALPSDLRYRKEREREFIGQLLNVSSIPSFEIPFPLVVKLRAYQSSGINWLLFLKRYQLHGILCDDMGLGKTLMSIIVLSVAHYEKKQGKGKGDFGSESKSLVIVPPTLGGHWLHEIRQFVPESILKAFLYSGSSSQREELRTLAFHGSHDVVITSYDILRNDNVFFTPIHWNYIILDEGHIIKNPKAKITLSVKLLRSDHRVILSGTPLQNSVLELWSLFDFLMPGYLGSEKQFSFKYSKPILYGRESKSSDKERESGALAVESLHRQVLPFILRRMKEDVLRDLPAKIMADYYCDLSALQVKLYETFLSEESNRVNRNTNTNESESKKDSKAHIFQSLQYLRKVCNHPKLVMSDEGNVNLNDISVAAKLPALRDLLHECGIGVSLEDELHSQVLPSHRALIFFQHRAMMDIVEKDLLVATMPTVTYLRLDGSVPPSQRHGIASLFNSDVSIDLLLLSTSIGGLGLNLTGADTVIFTEHDWNPMKDLQAMDRAHRLGQKKVVNVYRIITRNTIEEKILSLQQFKIKTANVVISKDNSSFESLGTEQILDLFSLDETNTEKSKNESQKPGLKALLNNLPELWDTTKYEEEYNLNNYINKL